MSDWYLKINRKFLLILRILHSKCYFPKDTNMFMVYSTVQCPASMHMQCLLNIQTKFNQSNPTCLQASSNRYDQWKASELLPANMSPIVQSSPSDNEEVNRVLKQTRVQRGIVAVRRSISMRCSVSISDLEQLASISDN